MFNERLKEVKYSSDPIIIIGPIIVGFLSSQRFSIPLLSAYICILPLIFSLVFVRQLEYGRTFIFLALIAISDLGAGVYTETSSYVKYFLYFTAATICVRKVIIGFVPLMLTLIYLSILTICTVLNYEGIDFYTFARDVLTLLFFLAIIFSKISRGSNLINIDILYYFSIGLLASELTNLVFFHSFDSANYLNYNSMKCAVTICSFGALMRGRIRLALLLFSLTILILVAYTSKILLLSYLFTFVTLMYKYALARAFKKFYMLVFLPIPILIYVIYGDNLQSFRVFDAFSLLFESQSFAGYLQLLDVTRYFELMLFLDRNLFRILLGDGLGAGIADVNGLLNFVVDDGGAFSSTEIANSVFYRFHDSWIWFGLRFGLLIYAFILLKFISAILGRHSNAAIAAALAFMFFLNSTFSIGGLIATAILTMNLKKQESQ